MIGEGTSDLALGPGLEARGPALARRGLLEDLPVERSDATLEHLLCLLERFDLEHERLDAGLVVGGRVDLAVRDERRLLVCSSSPPSGFSSESVSSGSTSRVSSVCAEYLRPAMACEGRRRGG